MMKDYYKILGIPENADHAAIIRAYEKNIHTFVPKHFKDRKFLHLLSEQMTACVVLTNPALRLSLARVSRFLIIRNLIVQLLMGSFDYAQEAYFDFAHHDAVVQWIYLVSLMKFKRELQEDSIWERLLLWWVR